MSTRCTPLPSNQLLASLPPEVTAVLAAHLEPVELATREALYQAGTVLHHVHFPVTAVVSLVSPLMDCACKLCRFLLQHIDRQAGDELRIAHERIAGMLGVRREGVTGAAQNLQRTGLIRYRRGHMRVIDRHGLEAHSCECYGVVQRAYERLRSDSPVWPSQLPRADRHPGPQPRVAPLMAPLVAPDRAQALGRAF